MSHINLTLLQAVFTAGHCFAQPTPLESSTPAVYGAFGRASSSVPDADGDSASEALVGAPDEAGGAERAGRAYVFSGTTGALIQTLVSPNPQQAGRFGMSVAGVLDADGDGRGDVLVGAPGEDGGARSAGRAYLFSGATGALLRTLVSPNSKAGGSFGYSVAALPAVGGDGRPELLVAAYAERGGAQHAGRAYLYRSSGGTPVEPGAEAADVALSVAPNRMRRSAAISLLLKVPQAVTVEVYNAQGRRAAILYRGPLAAGPHAAGPHAPSLDASRLPPGGYVARALAGSTDAAQRVTVLKRITIPSITP